MTSKRAARPSERDATAQSKKVTKSGKGYVSKAITVALAALIAFVGHDGNMASSLEMVHDFSFWPVTSPEPDWEARRDDVRAAFVESWSAYTKYAWGEYPRCQQLPMLLSNN